MYFVLNVILNLFDHPTINSASSGLHKCPYCPRVDRTKRSWYRHVATHDISRLLWCTFCKNYKTFRPDVLKKHLEKCPFKTNQLLAPPP